MLSGIASYIFGAPAEEGHSIADATALAEQIRLKTSQDDDDEWTIVDRASRKYHLLSYWHLINTSFLG